MTTRFVVVLLSLACFAGTLCAGEDDQPLDIPSLLPEHQGEPLDLLPPHVVVPRGALSLFADFENARDGAVDLYLVNRTEEPVTVPNSDGDLYARLEALSPKDQWERAQTLNYSFCGNSTMYPRSLASGSFYRVRTPWPGSGEERPVRFRIHSALALVSKIGLGLVEPSSIEEARGDGLARSQFQALMDSAHLQLVERAIFDWESMTPPGGIDPRYVALGRLNDFPREQALPIVQRLIAQESLPDWLYERALYSLTVISREAACSHAETVIRTGPAGRRQVVLGQLTKPYLQCDSLLAALSARARDPGEPELERVIAAVSLYSPTRHPEAGLLLGAIAADPRFPEVARQLAQRLREQRFPEGIVAISLTVKGHYRHHPIEARLTLRNLSERDLRFSYDKATEWLELWAETEGERLSHKPGVRWLTGRDAASGEGRTHVSLAPGETHDVTLDLRDTLLFPSGGAYNFRARCLIAGLHERAVWAQTDQSQLLLY